MTTAHQRTWHRGAHTCFIPPMVLLPWLISVSSHGGHPVHYLMASTGWDVYPSAKSTWSCRHPLPLHITRRLHPSSVDGLADVHGRNYSFPLIYPREVFLVWHWVIARPLSSCGVASLSLPPGVGLTGVGVVHPTNAWQTPTHNGHQFLMQWGGVSCGVGCVTAHVDLSHCTRGCLLQSDAPPH